LRWFVGVKIWEGPKHAGSLGLYRRDEQGPFSQQELGALKALSPRLMGVAELAMAFEFKRLDAKLSAFERTGSPVMLIDRDGEALRLNPSAERLLGDDLKIFSHRLVSWSFDATRALDRALHTLIREGRASVDPVILPRKIGRPIVAYPSRLTGEPYERFSPARALIVFADLEARRRVDARALTGALGLCASEAKLTALLAGGTSLECAAEQLGVSINTARTQIKRVFEKTDTHSQGQLIALVSQLISPRIIHLGHSDRGQLCFTGDRVAGVGGQPA
jgi:DNA-binding CsgD family transcriptional regulator/PAS domain-containing protein